MEEPVLSEATARLLEDLKLLLDERSLCLAQKRASFSLSLSKRHREQREIWNFAYRFAASWFPGIRRMM
jgi:hypothetical protein